MPNLIGTSANQVSTNGMLGTAAFLDTTPAQELATGAAIASAATVNLDIATGNRVHITGTTTITAVTLTRGPRTLIFDAVLTLTHNATTNNLPGAANITTAVGDRAIYESDGATVYCLAYVRSNGLGVVSASVGDHEIYVNSGNGNGSVNTFVRRYTTVVRNVGTSITYADSATAGASFTINQTGLYSVFNLDFSSVGAGTFCIGVNATPTLQAASIALANTAAQFYASTLTSASSVVRLTAGDVLRPFGPSATNASGDARTIIRMVGI